MLFAGSMGSVTERGLGARERERESESETWTYIDIVLGQCIDQKAACIPFNDPELLNCRTEGWAKLS